jgi:hypothetical protein
MWEFKLYSLLKYTFSICFSIAFFKLASNSGSSFVKGTYSSVRAGSLTYSIIPHSYVASLKDSLTPGRSVTTTLRLQAKASIKTKGSPS